MFKNAKPTSNSRKSEKSVLDALLIAREMALPKHLERLAFGRKPRIRATAHFKRWQLQEAKAKFSELFERAIEEGPQVVTRRNKQAVVILAETDYKKLKHSWKTPSLVEALLAMPKVPGFKIPERIRDNMVPLDRSVFD